MKSDKKTSPKQKAAKAVGKKAPIKATIASKQSESGSSKVQKDPVPGKKSAPGIPSEKAAQSKKPIQKAEEPKRPGAAEKAKAKPAKAPKAPAEPRKLVAPGRKTELIIPPILLEGDRPTTPPISGPGQRYALGPTPPVEHFAEMEELPEAYGTKRLIVTARDPHWLYAHWDFTREQLNKYNALSTDGHLVLRVYKDEIRGNPLTQVHVHPESRNWFIHVAEGNTKYIAEIGYYNRAGKWVQLAPSGATFTPPDQLSEDTSVRFATIPVDVPFEELVRLVKAAVSENVPLAEAIQQLRASGYKALPEPSKLISGYWTPEQERALSSLISMDAVRRVWIGSLEITELIRRQLAEQVSSISVAELGQPSSISVASLASPFGGMEKRKGFWFNVNAELIIYGATEPDATVTIGGRRIRLRPDGTFSYRFILPDGNYNLPAQATSADGEDSRRADLNFSRSTEYSGEVGAHPQDPAMKPPLVAHVA